MPTYEFRCPKGHKFSHFYKTMSTAPSQLSCTECGAVAERQLSGGAGFSFKGSGFYLTDYGKNAHRGEKAAAPASESSGESAKKSDSSAPTAVKAESAPKSDSAPKPKAESPKPKAKE